ncbi:hypothetical protein A8B82_21200 [Sulfitobacter sp. EhC04]|uniref:hypothetical protein n=1 Tax=Sulfitobacter sp. EhC04 TaxID=1849168 RepID=UPI0007F43214|nr:hypothetical protein [Sulfitobacter sp. EhC04]OAN71112.1 hypothetical protein A8B82_21200 [Sulfitobacter sp. EhC04]
MTLPIRTWAEQKDHEALEGNMDSRAAWVRSLVPHVESLNDASRKFGCPHTTLRSMANNYGVKFPSGCAKKSKIDEAEMRALSANGITAREAAKHFKCSPTAVRVFARARGIALTLEERSAPPPVKLRPEPKPPEPARISGADVMAMYAKKESAALRRVGRR